MERIEQIEKELKELERLTNNIKMDFLNLNKGKFTTRIVKHLIALQLLVTDLKTDLDYIKEQK